MAVTEQDIIDNAAGIAALVNGAAADVTIGDLPEATGPLVATNLLHIQEGGVDKGLPFEDSGLEPPDLDPVEIALDFSGDTVIDLSLYVSWVNFKITLTADSRLTFTNMMAGQTGYINIVQDGSTLYTFSYLGNFHGDTIAAPAIAEKNTESFILSALGTADAVEPEFGTKTNI